ncbi:MAG: FAD:protein FMN transferase [Fidelibacterota bacterium]|nr:MAG: FAD:protein FMN transferase [Candidatus Neomarinimicrobiota bacterium]
MGSGAKEDCLICLDRRADVNISVQANASPSATRFIRRLRLAYTFLPALVLLAGLSPGCSPASVQLYSTTFPALGTLVRLTLEVPDSITARHWVNQVSTELTRIGYEFWEGEPNGALGRLNRERWTDSQELISLIQRAFEVTDLTDGAFDIRIGELMHSYGFVNIWSRPQPLDSLDLLIRAAQTLRFEPQAGGYRLTGSDATLTLGGIAKGYAVDQCVRLLQQLGCRSGIVNAGGDLRVWGRPETEPWLIGVEDPETHELLAALALNEGGCATSGSYRNRYLANGDTIHHLIEPRSGLPAKGKMSVTVTAPSCELADALATGMFIMPLHAALALADSLQGVGLLVLSNEPALHQDDDMARLRSAAGE